MEKMLNDYLEKIEHYLKPLPVSERVDIVQEIRSEMLELQNEGKTAEEITRRLGHPKELARAYLGDWIGKSEAFGWDRVAAICAFYSLAGFSGLFVIPVLGICAPACILCAIVAPVAGAVKMVDALLHLGIPYARYIGIAGVENPVLVFFLSAALGEVLYLIGRGCWELLVCYIKGVGKVKRRLSL